MYDGRAACAAKCSTQCAAAWPIATTDTRLNRGTCDNGRGVPVTALDREVRHKLHTMLTDEETVWQLCSERAARFTRERTSKNGTRQNIEKEIAKLEAEIARLTAAVAAGKDMPTAAFNERRAKVEALKVKVTEAPALVDRPTFNERMTAIGPLSLGEPVMARQALRKVAFDRITVTPDEGGWRFEGLADLGRLVGGSVNNGHPTPSETSPRTGCAGRAGARTVVTPTRS